MQARRETTDSLASAPRRTDSRRAPPENSYRGAGGDGRDESPPPPGKPIPCPDGGARGCTRNAVAAVGGDAGSPAGQPVPRPGRGSSPRVPVEVSSPTTPAGVLHAEGVSEMGGPSVSAVPVSVSKDDPGKQRREESFEAGSGGEPPTDRAPPSVGVQVCPNLAAGARMEVPTGMRMLLERAIEVFGSA